MSKQLRISHWCHVQQHAASCKHAPKYASMRQTNFLGISSSCRCFSTNSLGEFAQYMKICGIGSRYGEEAPKLEAVEKQAQFFIPSYSSSPHQSFPSHVGDSEVIPIMVLSRGHGHGFPDLAPSPSLSLSPA
jgi:hypothetical protein